MAINVVLIIIGLAFLLSGAELLVKGASNIAKKFHIPEILIGLTIVSIGTSMPELIITVKSALEGSTDLIVGDSVGSDLVNLLMILGLMAIIRPITIQDETKHFHIPIAFLSTLIVFIIAELFGAINLAIGIIFLILFVAYLAYPIILDRKKIAKEYEEEKETNEKQPNTFLQILFIVAGVVLLKYGGDFVVDSATAIAEIAGVSEGVIGLTIIAIGTALPELVTSIIATISGSEDIGVGNLIGSSVLNSFLILGLGALFTPIVISAEFTRDLILLMASTLLLWAFCYIPKKNTITRGKGVILFAIYMIYLISLFV